MSVSIDTLREVTGMLTKLQCCSTQFQHRIFNVETTNVMDLAHERFPGNVDAIPLDDDGKPVGLTAGHGKWYVAATKLVSERD